jgi:hypothetical protein
MKVYAEYQDPAQLAKAIPAVRAWASVRLDAYLPYPVAEIDRALAGRPSRLSTAVFAAGLGGAAGAYGLQWLLDAYLYPLDVGGRPPHFPLAFVPITFEMGVLFAALTAFVSVIVGSRLLRLWDPSRDVEGIESATHTSFWLVVEPGEGAADLDALYSLLERSGARAIRMEAA